jgi:hypothetical protein
MLLPSIFVNGSGDLTVAHILFCPKLKEWIEHI